ncbi:MAG TPA: Uma2 family endonuclease [Ktedonobacteraceae bacterium]|nr:Uma2 family endonuclease [Ktedonobacteraceae bacterium]
MSIDSQQTQPLTGGPMSTEEYLRLDKRILNAKYEYLDGVARLMSGGSGEHDQISRNTANALERHFQSGPCFVHGSDMQVLISTKSTEREHYVYPDVTISCDVADRRRGNTLIRSPRIVVEVLSPSTEAIDRGKKLAAYKACPTIQEIVLISQFAPHVEIYRRSETDQTTWSYEIFGPGSAVVLKSVDVRLALDELYKSINFDEPLVEE